MSLRFVSQLQVDNLPDEQLNDQFEVIMPAFKVNGGYTYRPIVEDITFGHRNFIGETRRVRTGWLGVPKDIEKYHEAKLSMFCPASMATQYYLETWKKEIFNDEGEYYYSHTKYKRDIEVFIYGPGGSVSRLLPKCHYTLQGCFPISQKDYEFEYTDDPKRFRILVTFNVDRVRVDDSIAKAAMLTEFCTSPTSLLDNLISSAGTNLVYDLNKVYGEERTGLSVSEILNNHSKII